MTWCIRLEHVNYLYRIVCWTVAGVLLIDMLEYFKSLVGFATFDQEFGAFGEEYQPSGKK